MTAVLLFSLCSGTRLPIEPKKPAAATPAATQAAGRLSAQAERRTPWPARSTRRKRAPIGAQSERNAAHGLAKRRDKQDIVIDDYVLTQPPVYAGPRQAGRSVRNAGRHARRPRRYIPVVADFLQSAADHFGFVPQRPRSEIEFKRAYARMAAGAGLTRDQVVRIYGLRVRRQRQIRCAGGIGIREAGRPRHQHGARLQSAADRQQHRAFWRKKGMRSSRP